MVPLLVSIRKSLHFNVSDALWTHYGPIISNCWQKQLVDNTRDKVEDNLGTSAGRSGMTMVVIRESDSGDVQLDLANISRNEFE